TNSQLITIWDNLFYQLITNKSAYVRDLVINVLIANHYLKSSELPESNKTVLSKVVIPQEFYGTVSLPATGIPFTEPVYTKPLREQIERVLATEKATQITVLTEELKKAQQAYNEKTSIQYEAARNAYDAYCYLKARQNELVDTTPAVIDPSTDLEPFSFTAAPEMTELEVSKFLSAQSNLLATGYNLFNQPDFKSAFIYLDNELKKQTAISFDEENVSSQVLKLNNALLPVSQGLILPQQQYAYTMQVVPVTATASKILVSINMGYPNADAVHAN
ncbi:MAG: hypothetical protein ABUL44_04960, partial [Flavobacterium sp.]